MKLKIIYAMLLITLCGKAQQRECVIQTYTAEIGVREATGHNDGDQVEKYLQSTGLSKGNAWCAAFVNWVNRHCNVSGPRAAAAWSPVWFPSYRITKDPQPGDVFGIYFPQKGRIAHVGFIDQWGNQVRTVEGNTNEAGSREGDGVYKKIRLARQINVVSNWID